ncbi:MAG: thiamine pyrophosphate-dependent enzyme [Verrucomicrobiota bacterium]
MTKQIDYRPLIRRMVEIDYRYKHRHLPGSLSAIRIIADIYSAMDLEHDVFILSKGHSCAALYAVLESYGMKPDVTLVHPERDLANGIQITAGSLGHGLPIGVGMAWAMKLRQEPGLVHVLLGDGECQEGTTWEALHLAARLRLQGKLIVHLDHNGYQGSDALVFDGTEAMKVIYPIQDHHTRKGAGIKMFEDNPVKSVHLVTDADYKAILKELEDELPDRMEDKVAAEAKP